MLMMFDKTVFWIGNQVYSIVVEAVVSLSADGTLCLFLYVFLAHA